jgi:tetratricopeptide (TPR) repeat protein
MRIKKTDVIRFYLILVFAVLNTGNLFAQEGDTELSKSEIKEFVENASQKLIEQYVYKEIGENVAEYITKRFQEGAYDTILTAKSFEQIMTDELQSISHDKHMRVRIRRTSPQRRSGSDPILDQYIRTLESQEENYGFHKVEILESNIGYIDFRYFASPFAAGDRVVAVMSFLKYTDAIIFDLRKNGGGNPEMIQLMCSYLFDEKVHLNSLFWREGDQTVEYWTLDQIDGERMPDVPVFVLTSHYTFSGAEEFTYNLKTRNRAIIIGETTGGGANPGGMQPITERFGMFIPTGRAINPVTGINWEGTGVEPDVKVEADSALAVARRKAMLKVKEYKEKKIKNAKALISNIHLSEDEVESLINAGKSDEATEKLFKVLDSGKKQGILNEMSINRLGYEFLRQEKNNSALIVFKYNVKAHPDASNAYDSLGEAYMKLGMKDKAIQNYEKSLKLNPNNNNATKMLEKLKGN